MKKKRKRDDRWEMCLQCIGAWRGRVDGADGKVKADAMSISRKEVLFVFEGKLRQKYKDNAKWKKPCEGKCPHKLELLVLSQMEEKDGLKRIKKARKRFK